MEVSYSNDATPGVYSLNRNYAAYTIEKVSDKADFTLWDEQTVKRLVRKEPKLMPNYPKSRALKRGIDLAYGKKQITASITSSILQGKSIKGIADDLQERMTTMNRASAIRTARTAVTGAQNAGRMDSYAAAEKMGIKLKKEWLATLDSRTRHSHARMDGEQVDQDKKFSNGCRFPGDPRGKPAETYNCRCTMIAAVAGVDTSDAQRRARNPQTGETELVSNMTYQEWVGRKKEAKRVESERESGIIENGSIKGIGLQFFANKSIKTRSDKELKKSIKSWDKNIAEHKAKIANPEKYDANWADKTEERRAGLLKHWAKEIKNFQENIDLSNEELERRKNGR